MKLEKELALAYILEHWNGSPTKYSDEVGEYAYFDTVEEGSSRWENHFMGVIRHRSDNTYWAHDYSIGKSETQDYRSWDYEDELEFYQVEPERRVVETYEYHRVDKSV